VSYTAGDPELLADILDAARDIVEFCQGLDEESLKSDRRTTRALVQAFTVIGEAVKRLSDQFKAGHPSVDWRGAAGMRDILVHHYNRVDVALLLAIANTDVPQLIAVISPLVEEARTDDASKD
jgi:uncharacterized protein with HEPN domain